ncbi:MAG: molybdopterin-dependent oxidoreductase [Nitrospirae bacterium]|nr:molybdopterin-dependent oxidoreductase [Nitrospirota bacterium]
MSNGIKIPNLCYDRRVAPHGGCRLCIVEIEGQKKLEASCATLATEGLVVWTDTPKVKKVRQTVLELMLVHHPLDCPVCDKAGECDLQELVFQYGKPAGRFVRDRKHALPDTKGPFVELTANRCVLCGKCVRLCAEHQGRGALGFIGRGFPTVVQPAYGEALECDYCGQCIDVCPTGALLNKTSKFKARQWALEEKDTICPFCGCGCTLTLGIWEGKILRARGLQDKGINEGDLCGRGRFGFDYIYSEHRLNSPMIRKDGELVPASWDEALNYIRGKLKNIITAHGPSSIGATGSPRCTNEDNYVLQKFMRNTIGSDNIDSSAAFGYGLAEKAWKMSFGQSSHRINQKSPLSKEVVLILESDISVTHPVSGLNILQAKRQGAQLIVADGRETKLTRHSTQWLKMKSGTGVALLNGIMKVIIDRGLIDTAVAEKVPEFNSLKAMLENYTTGKVSEITGVSEDEIISAAETIAKAKSRMISLSVSASENTKGLDTALAAANLINLLGEGPDALQIPAEYSNTFGLYQMGVRPDSALHGQGIFEMFYSENSGIKAMYLMGENPAVNFPDSGSVIEKLKSLDLLIVQDIFLTETAKLAHVVLPASSWAEKDGTYMNAEGVMQKVHKLVGPSGDSLPDWMVLRNLALVMGKDLGITNLQSVQEEIKSLLLKRPAQDEIHRTFNPVEYVSCEGPAADYPFKLVVRDVLQHSGSMSTKSKSLGLVASGARLEINFKDAERFGISDNAHVKVTSPRGSAYLKAAVSDEVPDGFVYVPAHFPHSGVSALTHLAGNGGISMDAVRVETA